MVYDGLCSVVGEDVVYVLCVVVVLGGRVLLVEVGFGGFLVEFKVAKFAVRFWGFTMEESLNLVWVLGCGFLEAFE